MPPQVRGIVVAFSLLLTGCGLGTPNIYEFWGTQDDADDQMRMIVEQVRCELRRAVQLVMYKEVKERVPVQGFLLAFLNNWGADVLFQFTIDEKSSLNPIVSLTPPLPSVTAHFGDGRTTVTSQSESFGFGGQFSTQGYRQEKFHAFYKLTDLMGRPEQLQSLDAIYNRVCVQKNSTGTLMLQSDLKFYDWFRFVINQHLVNNADLEERNTFVSNGVIVHDVKFDILSAGNFTPTIKLFRISLTAGSSSFLNTSRERTQEVIITLGPAVGANKDELKDKAKNSAVASEIKAGFDSVISRLPSVILP